MSKTTTLLKTLRIQNFKGWKDTGDIELAPITLFFGTNSSGKSSIGQFLMMLKQTAESSDRKMILHTGNVNSYVNLGSFWNIIHRHDPKNELRFAYTWEPDADEKISFGESEKTVESIRFECLVGTDRNDNRNFLPNLKEFTYELSPADGTQKMQFSLKRNHQSKFELKDDEKYLKKSAGRPWGTAATLHFCGVPKELWGYYQNPEIFDDINLQQEKLFSKFFYLGPLRQAPSYLYSWSGYEPEEVGKAGQDTIAALLAGKDRKYSVPRPPKFTLAAHPKPSKTLQVVIAEALKHMGLIAEFEVGAISESHHGQYEVRIKTNGSPDFVNLPDVGFGISQILPVITELYYVPSRSVIIIEQPELHLHPKAQAALADVMFAAVNAWEYGRRNIQLLIETHSEHFLRRFLRRLAEDENDQLLEQFRAYFVDGSTLPAKLEQLKVDEYGEIANWPKDFFGDELGEISAQMEAGIAKRMKEENR